MNGSVKKCFPVDNTHDSESLEDENISDEGKTGQRKKGKEMLALGDPAFLRSCWLLLRLAVCGMDVEGTW